MLSQEWRMVPFWDQESIDAEMKITTRTAINVVLAAATDTYICVELIEGLTTKYGLEQVR